MEHLSSVQQENRGFIEEKIIDKCLHIEIISLIFSNLNNTDLHRTFLVNRLWKTVTLQEAKNKLISMIEYIIDNLDKTEDISQIEQLNNLKNNLDFSKASNMKEIKEIRIKTKAEIINILKHVKLPTLQKFDESYHYYKIFNSSKIEKEIEESNDKYWEIEKVVHLFLSKNNLKKVIYYENRVDFPVGTNAIADYLIKKGQLKEALELLVKFPEGKHTEYIFMILHRIKNAQPQLLSLEENVEKLLATINYIPQTEWRYSASLELLVEGFANIGQIDRAITIAHTIPHERYKQNALSNIEYCRQYFESAKDP